MDHGDDVTQELGVLGVGEPHGANTVRSTVAGRVESPRRQVTVEISQQAGDESGKRLCVLVRGHGRRLRGLHLGGHQAKGVRALHGTAGPALAHDLEHPGLGEQGHLSVQAPDGHVAQLGGELGGGEGPVTQKGLDYTQPDRVQQELGASHKRSLVHLFTILLTFAKLQSITRQEEVHG